MRPLSSPHPRRQTPAYLTHVAQMEAALKAFHISFEKKNNVLYSLGDVSFDFCNLEKLPNLTSLIVRGHFFVCGNRLTTLVGSPQYIRGDFHCQNNQLISLHGAPQHIGGHFNCSDNQITHLQGGPRSVILHYQCTNNKNLISLKGAPSVVKGFFCTGCPQLEDLEYAPQKFTYTLESDFGRFLSWEDIPRNIKLCARKREGQREAFKDALAKKQGLQKPLQVKRLKLRKIGRDQT